MKPQLIGKQWAQFHSQSSHHIIFLFLLETKMVIANLKASQTGGWCYGSYVHLLYSLWLKCIWNFQNKSPPTQVCQTVPPQKTPKINKLIKSPNFKECFKMCFWKIKATTYLLNIMKLLSHWRIFKTKQKTPQHSFITYVPLFYEVYGLGHRV